MGKPGAAAKARRRQPVTGGIKHPMRNDLVDWGEKAERIFRIRLCFAARGMRDKERALCVLKEATHGLSEVERKILLHFGAGGVERGVEDEACSEYAHFRAAMQRADYVDDLCPERRRLTTPIRSLLHINLLMAEGTYRKHPWGRFLGWFAVKWEDEMGSVFSREQRLEVRGQAHVRLVVRDGRPVAECCQHLDVDLFHIYDADEARAECELKRLRDRMRELFSSTDAAIEK